MINVKIILITVFIFNGILAQSVKVIESSKIEMNNGAEAFYPFFSNDDSKIFFSKNNYKGLYSVELNSKKTSVISESFGAGYNPLLLADEAILYRTHKIVHGRKYQSILSHDLKYGTENILEKDIRELQLPNQEVSSNPVVLKNRSPEEMKLKYPGLSKLGGNKKAIYAEDNDLKLVQENQVRTINPLGKGVYVWESFSLDGKMILFTYGNRGSFICDIDGNILDNITEAHFPRFSPNGKFVSYMVDKDNGTDYISSDIFVYSLEMKKSFAITKTDNQIEMYPNWSNDGQKLVYHTNDGKIFISTLQFEN